MENASPFEIETLQRDWIEGVNGKVFYAQFQNRRAEIEQFSVCDQARGLLISEIDPIRFSVNFFAAVSLGISVVLVNPSWGQRERAELDALLATDPPPQSILIPTGGSTGGVKLAIHDWASLTAACRGLQGFLGGGPINSCCVLPLYHVSGLMQLLRSFVSRGCIRFDEDVIEGACLSYVPTQLQRALSDSQRIQKMKTAKAIFVGGGPLPAVVAERARALKLPVVPVYGMTETAAMTAAIPVDEFIANPRAGAQPIGAAQFGVDGAGAIRIHSPALFSGYHGRPPVDLADGYLTDDEGRIDADGHLHVVGRMDRLIISGGEKIDPREVEQAMMKMEGVDDALAISLPDPEWGERLVAFYVSSGEEVDPEALKQALREDLVNYKIPKQMISVRVLPLDGRGKVDRKLMEQLIV